HSVLIGDWPCTVIYTLSLPDALPIWGARVGLLEQDVHLHDDDRTPCEVLALARGVDPADARDAAVDAHGLLAPRDLDRPLAVLRSEEHTSELQSRDNLVCRLLLENNK